MVSSVRPAALVLASSLLSVASVACAGSQYARWSNGVALPANGAKGGPAANALPLQTMSVDEWARAPSQKLAPVCDTRGVPARFDDAAVKAARRVIGVWTAHKKAEPRPDPKTTVRLAKPDPTSEVTSFDFTCAGVDGATTSTLQINGVAHAFDLAWAVVSSPLGEPEVSIEALSLKEGQLVFGDVQYSEKNVSSNSGKNIVTDISTYVDAGTSGADDPIVRNVAGAGAEPSFETLLFARGAVEGFYFEVPTNRNVMSSAYYAEVGRFRVSDRSK